MICVLKATFGGNKQKKSAIRHCEICHIRAKILLSMANIGNLKRPHNSPPLDKLAQLANFELKCQNEALFELNSTTSTNDKKRLLKRARRKYLSNRLALQLVNAGNKNGSKLVNSYWRSFRCCRAIFKMADDTLRTEYCKNRWCMVCNSIRTAQLINDYVPLFNELPNKYFVTLTIPNMIGLELPNAIKNMQKSFNSMRKTFEKRHKKNEMVYLVGVRKLECTYNAIFNDYHPHYHLIIDGEKNAADVVSYWLKKYPKAKRAAQDIRPADMNSVKELFKYFTKVVCKHNSKNEYKIYADALDIMFQSIKGKRIFQSFGMTKPKAQPKEDNVILSSDVSDIYEWNNEVTTWVNEQGEKLVEYIPGAEFKNLVEKKITVRDTFYFNHYMGLTKR